MVTSLGISLIVALNILQEPEKVTCHLSVLTARNQVTGLGYVIQIRKAWGEDLKTEGVQDQGSGLLADIVSQGLIAKMEGKPTWCTAENKMAS